MYKLSSFNGEVLVNELAYSSVPFYSTNHNITIYTLCNNITTARYLCSLEVNHSCNYTNYTTLSSFEVKWLKYFSFKYKQNRGFIQTIWKFSLLRTLKNWAIDQVHNCCNKQYRNNLYAHKHFKI